ncbi:inositol monophosphatase family protein [Lacticaseibacillus yichunensis]|uniref:Inositol monophosphatase family protein n=1 Tax=Lacticaseibacillus yichunensis TaxID=2486015 RepID=A0ABW4CNS7_9LACO|nr:inositol monophosphatase family protein [Lacticaseibacillus yichunensis]
MMLDLKRLENELMAWLGESRVRILDAMNTPLHVDVKSGRNDLVTNVDKANQRFLTNKILAAYPDARIEGEEGTAEKVHDLAGTVFFLDPIDGTMNFVKQHANFAVMIGVYENGAPRFGAILDVMRNEVLTGGPTVAPKRNGRRLPLPKDHELKDGLMGASGPLLIHNKLNVQVINEASSGTRITGSAGIEFKAIIEGQQIGYISYLQPWDVAAGMAIGAHFGLQVTRPDGKAINMLEPGFVVAALPSAYRDIRKLIVVD